MGNDRRRNKEKQAWLDPQFHAFLKKVQAELIINDIDAPSIAEVSRRLLECKSMEEVKKELIRQKKQQVGLRIDEKNIFK